MAHWLEPARHPAEYTLGVMQAQGGHLLGGQFAVLVNIGLLEQLLCMVQHMLLSQPQLHFHKMLSLCLSLSLMQAPDPGIMQL